MHRGLLRAFRSVFVVLGARDGDTERRARLLMIMAAVLLLVFVFAAAKLYPAPGTFYAWLVAVPIGIPATLATLLLARRAKADVAALLLGAFTFSALALVAWAEGPGSNRMSVAIMGVAIVGAVVSTRLTALFGLGLVAIIVGLAAAQATGAYQPVESSGAEPLYAPFARQSVAIGAMVLVLRRGYERVQQLISDRERARAAAVEAARTINSSLEALVTERTSTLSATRDRLSGLAAQLATDLTASLATMRGQLEAFATAEAALGDAGLRYVTKAGNAVARLSVMTERLHEHARLGTAALRPSTIDMDALVRDVIDDHARNPSPTWHQRRPASRPEWQIDPLPAAWGDPTLVRTVVENLISNAIKFSRTREAPRIHVGVEPRGYFVRDNGVGFDPAWAGRLFSAFHRLHGEDEFEGHGLGLANARRILQRSGGEITAEAELDRGATFYFRLPRAEDRT